jgi:hypothetical protein
VLKLTVSQLRLAHKQFDSVYLPGPYGNCFSVHGGERESAIR